MDDAPLVFVHGILGGRMLDGAGRLRWISPLQALGIDRRPLTSPITWSEAGQDRDDLVPDGPLDAVLGVPVYRRFLRWAAARSCDFQPLAYDWRRDLPESVERLRVHLQALADRHGRPARLVAHSMGGLVSWLLLREHPHLVSGVLFVGVPFGPGISFGGGMHAGHRMGLNSRIADVVAHGSWTAPHAFFPAGDAQVQGADHSWYDASSWQRQGLGVFADPDRDPEPWLAHLRRALEASATTRARLDEPHPNPESLPPLAVLSGVGNGSVQAAIKGGPASVRGWDFRSGPSIDGDGSVSVPSTFPPGDLELQSATSTVAHQQLLDDLPAVEALLSGLVARGG